MSAITVSLFVRLWLWRIFLCTGAVALSRGSKLAEYTRVDQLGVVLEISRCGIRALSGSFVVRTRCNHLSQDFPLHVLTRPSSGMGLDRTLFIQAGRQEIIEGFFNEDCWFLCFTQSFTEIRQLVKFGFYYFCHQGYFF